MTTTMQRDWVLGTSVSTDHNRDRQLVRFVARHGIVSIEHAMRELAVGRTAAYRRVATCIGAGLLERLELLRDEPSLLRATREGLRYAGLEGLKVAEVSPGGVEHWLRCTSTAQLLAAHFGPERIRTERELVFAEHLAERPIASAVMGRLPNGKPRLHRPDLVILPADPGDAGSASDWGHAWPSRSRTQGARRGERTDVRDQAGRTEDAEMRRATRVIQPIAVEVELTPKAPRRLEAIICAWRDARWIREVHYHCAPGQTRRAVERAILRAGAGGRVAIGEAVSR
jgi:hypothetical protein